MGIRVDKRDTVFSKLIRGRDGCCVKCGRSDTRLECSHIFSRRHIATRWDLMNAKTLCHTCHRWWHSNPTESGAWAEGYFGEGVIAELRRKALTPTKLTKRDKEDIYKDLKQRLELMEATGLFDGGVD